MQGAGSSQQVAGSKGKSRSGYLHYPLPATRYPLHRPIATETLRPILGQASAIEGAGAPKQGQRR